MATERQILANRANSQKSTGPRTHDGKAAVAGNAIQHGLTARTVVLATEDEGQYQLFRDEMLAGMDLVGPYERLLAQLIVEDTWRVRRALRVESQTMDVELAWQQNVHDDRHRPYGWRQTQDEQRHKSLPEGYQDVPEGELELAYRVLRDFSKDGEHVLLRYSRYHSDIERAIYRNARQLRLVQQDRRRQGPAAPQSQTAQANSSLPPQNSTQATAPTELASVAPTPGDGDY